MSDQLEPGRGLDGLLHETFCGPVLYLGRGPMRDGGLPVPNYTGDLGAAHALFAQAFPGFAFGLASRSGRDEVWAEPDLRNDTYGEAWAMIWAEGGEFRSTASPSPGGRPAIALCAVTLNLAIALRDDAAPANGISALADMGRRARSPDRTGEPLIDVGRLLARKAELAVAPA